MADEPSDAGTVSAAAQAEARAGLASLAAAAVARSQQLGAARLLAEAAEADAEEAAAALRPRATADASVGPAWSHARQAGGDALAQGQLSLSLSGLIADGGRTDRLIESRRLLAEAARRGEAGTQEQVVLVTVQQALEMARLALQRRIYEQHGRKMACLVEALEAVVAADRGRASELVQASKSAAQVDLARVEVESRLRQAEVRLRRLVGDVPAAAVPPDALAAALPAPPSLPEMLALAERAFEIRQLDAQAAALARAAQAVEAGRKPQFSWVASASQSAAAGASAGPRHSTSLGIALNVSLPVLSPGLDAAAAAAQRRAAAASAQQDDALEARRTRVREVDETRRALVERLARLDEVIVRSEQVRRATLQQWQQLGRRSLFDVIAAESEHYSLRLAKVNALVDLQQALADLLAAGSVLSERIKP